MSGTNSDLEPVCPGFGVISSQTPSLRLSGTDH